MANGYETPAEDAADTAPEGPAEDAGESQGKISKQQANYRESNKVQCCGLCANFTGSAGEGAYQCTKVDGQISPFGFSDLYERQDNPFRTGETGEFTGGTPVAPSLAAMGGLTPAIGGPNPPVVSMTQGPPQTANPRVAQTGAMQGPAVNGSRLLRIGGKMYQ